MLAGKNWWNSHAPLPLVAGEAFFGEDSIGLNGEEEESWIVIFEISSLYMPGIQPMGKCQVASPNQ